ncbi:MAG: hypothetical protein H6711_26720 [Myxococcales bacterium]|nr:hypothetical protein [Myxococcales bacterium]
MRSTAPLSTALSLSLAALVACGGDPSEGSTATDGSGSESSSGSSASTSTASSSATATSTSASGSGSGEATSDSTSGAATETGTASATASTANTSDATATTGEPTSGTTDTSGTSGTTVTTGTGTGDTTTTGGVEPDPLLDKPNLWYSVAGSIMYIELDPSDGSVVKLVHNQLMADVQLWHGQNGLTMLEDGSLLGSRESAMGAQIFHIPDPPITENTPAQAKYLGIVPSDKMGVPPPRIEALYTDCDGRVYLMDTGKDVSNADGNRLLRFKGDFLGGDLTYDVITDLQKASVADIDDMSPGIVNNEINDLLGFAMDSSFLWQLDYTTGTGMNLAKTAGTWGIHALGAPLFDDQQARLYVLSAGDADTGAELFLVDLGDYSSGAALVEGPDLDLQSGYNGWSGLAGPLTECMTKIPQ